MSDEKKKASEPIATPAKPPSRPSRSSSKVVLHELRLSRPSSPIDEINRQIAESQRSLAEYYRSIVEASSLPLLVSPDYSEFHSNLLRLHTKVSDTAKAVAEESDAEKKEKQLKELQKQYRELNDKLALNHLLHRVGPQAQKKLLADNAFRQEFSREEPCDAFVVSIDIRRSTELMLKAREPKLFAVFISQLAASLREIVIANLGIFDKFTGDGILAFFPDFYSGPDAGYRAVHSALKCHDLFRSHYEANRSCFFSILRDVGLGIGIDFGKVQLVEIGGDFTVVGTPVVYACRMAGAPAGKTYTNQPAYEVLFAGYESFDYEETLVNIKHEGETLAYDVRANGKNFAPREPQWLEVPAKGGRSESEP